MPESAIVKRLRELALPKPETGAGRAAVSDFMRREQELLANEGIQRGRIGTNFFRAQQDLNTDSDRARQLMVDALGARGLGRSGIRANQTNMLNADKVKAITDLQTQRTRSNEDLTRNLTSHRNALREKLEGVLFGEKDQMAQSALAKALISAQSKQGVK